MSEWIDIKDKTPANEALVLIAGWLENNPKKGRFYVVAVHNSHGQFYDPDDGDDFHPPTHWMPLKELP